MFTKFGWLLRCWHLTEHRGTGALGIRGHAWKTPSHVKAGVLHMRGRSVALFDDRKCRRNTFLFPHKVDVCSVNIECYKLHDAASGKSSRNEIKARSVFAGPVKRAMLPSLEPCYTDHRTRGIILCRPLRCSDLETIHFLLNHWVIVKLKLVGVTVPDATQLQLGTFQRELACEPLGATGKLKRQLHSME
jgi:hypothetical protein